MRLCPRDCSVEQITAARYRLDKTVVIVAELVTQLPNALRDRVVGHGHVGPYGLVKLLLGDQPPGVLCEVTKYLEGLGPQLDIVVARAQTSARQIEREVVE